MKKSILAFLYKEFGLFIVQSLQFKLFSNMFLYLFNQKIFLILPIWLKMLP